MKNNNQFLKMWKDELNERKVTLYNSEKEMSNDYGKQDEEKYYIVKIKDNKPQLQMIEEKYIDEIVYETLQKEREQRKIAIENQMKELQEELKEINHMDNEGF